MSTPLRGGCLCGAVRYETEAEPMITGHCHCVDCRKSSGTGHCTHVALPADSLRITGEIRFYDRPADSGALISRGFCPVCGSAILSKNDRMAALSFVRASSLDDPNAVSPTMIVYASRAPVWDMMDPSLPSFPEMPPGGPEQAIAEA